MNIREINTSSKFATVTFDYDELRCLCNSLYEVSKFDDVEKDDNFNNVYAKIIELFALVKHGKIPEFELKKMYELFYGNDHPTEKGGEEVRHGEWMHLGGDEWCCANCGEVITTEGSWEKPKMKYCNECGAKMDGGKAE